MPLHELDDDAAAGLVGLDVTIRVGENGDERAALVDLGK